MSTPSTILPSFTFTNASTTTATSSCGPCPWLMIEPGLATWSPGNSSIPALRSTQLYVDPNYNTTSTSISCNSAAISAYTPADDYWVNDECELVAKYLAFAVGTEWFWETVTLTETAGSSLRVGGLFSAGGPITTTNDDGQSTCTNRWVTRFPTMVTYTDPVIETISGGNAFWLMPDLSKYFPDVEGVEQCTLIMPGGSPVALTPANDIKLPVITLDFTRSSTVPPTSRTTSSSNSDPTTTQARPGGGSNTALPTETSTSQEPPSSTPSDDDQSTSAIRPSAIIQPTSTGTLIVPPQEGPEEDEDLPTPAGGNESSPEPSDSADPDEEDRPSDNDEPSTAPSDGSSDNDNEDTPSDNDEPSTPPSGGSSDDGNNDDDESNEPRPTQPATVPSQESNDESNDDNPPQNDSPINPAEDDSSDSSGGNSNQESDNDSDEADSPSNGGSSNQQDDSDSDEADSPSNGGNSNQQSDDSSDESNPPSNGSSDTSSDQDDTDSSAGNDSQQSGSSSNEADSSSNDSPNNTADQDNAAGNSDGQQSLALGDTTQAAGAQPTAGGSNGDAPSSRTIPVINTNQPSVFLTESGSALVVGPSVTISAGGQVATAGGTTFSVLPSSQGVVAFANGESSTMDASSLTPAAGNDASSAPHIVEAPDSQGFVVDELSITAGGAAATISGSTFSALPSGSGVVVVADGQSTTVSGSSLADYGIDTPSEGQAEYGLPNQSLSPGGAAATIQGTTYSALPGSSGIIVEANGATTTLDAAEATKVAAEATRIPPVDTISGVQSVSNGYVLGESVTVTVGGAPTTISGTVYSALPSGGGVLAIDEDESDDFAPFIEQGISGENGEADGDEAGSYVVAGDVTITVGESAATVSGTVYSALPSGSGVVAVADGRTTTRAASTTRSENGPEATGEPGDDGDDDDDGDGDGDDDVVAVYDGDESAAVGRVGIQKLAGFTVLVGFAQLLW